MEKVKWARQTGAIVGSKTHLEEPKAEERKKKKPKNGFHKRKNVNSAVNLPCLWVFLVFPITVSSSDYFYVKYFWVYVLSYPATGLRIGF